MLSYEPWYYEEKCKLRTEATHVTGFFYNSAIKTPNMQSESFSSLITTLRYTYASNIAALAGVRLVLDFDNTDIDRTCFR